MRFEQGPGPLPQEITDGKNPSPKPSAEKIDMPTTPEIGINPEYERGPKIKFPENIETVKALQDKLAEYKNRLKLQREEKPFKAPESFTDTNYKIAILERLLLEGEVDTHDLSRELHKKDKFVDATHFENACAVINDYVKTGGKHVRGGSGIRSGVAGSQR